MVNIDIAKSQGDTVTLRGWYRVILHVY